MSLQSDRNRMAIKQACHIVRQFCQTENIERATFVHQRDGRFAHIVGTVTKSGRRFTLQIKFEASK